MCGLAGWFGTSLSPDIDRPVIDGMLDRIAHRGPDGRGIAELPNGAGAMGHLRLAIIDPTGGQQPFWSQDHRCVIAFNGEIYNFRELRAQLIRQGASLRTTSDTEVVMELLCREGKNALRQLRGMFALAFWDGRKRSGILARDTLGIKPLFVRRDRDRLWFASEAKAFVGTPGWTPRIDCSQLHLLLNLRYPAGGQGLLQDVAQLAPGECLEWTGRGERSSRIEASPTFGHPDANLSTMIRDSVRAHLVADVPVSCYLSGGLDSAIVALNAAQLTERRIQSFTIDAGDDPSELSNARITADWLGIANTAGQLVPASTQALDWLLWHLEVPKINALQTAAAAQLASRQTKVCLSGLGSDELFLGYRAHAHLATWHRATAALGPAAGPLGRLLSKAFKAGRVGFGEGQRAMLMLASAGNVARAYAVLRNVWDGVIPRERIYGPRMLDQPLPDAAEWIEMRWPNHHHPVAAMAEFEWRNKMVDDLLWQEDRTSMASGLEVRVPFVDTLLAAHPTIERQPGRYHPGRKTLLRAAFASQLPGHILNRPKSGFQIDIAQHFDSLFFDVIAQWLSPERVRHHGLFSPSFVSEVLKLPRRRSYRWHFFMMLLMALSHRWIELFEQGDGVPSHQPELARLLS